MTEARRQILDNVNNLIEIRKKELLKLLSDFHDINDNIKKQELENFYIVKANEKIYNY